MKSAFTPAHINLQSLFAPHTKYVIPGYQRPYSWQAIGKNDKNNQVNQMWEDLWEFFSEQRSNSEYFLGSMVVIDKENMEYEVVDGQQRLTTLLLLLSAIKCVLCKQRDVAPPEFQDYVQRAIRTLDDMIYNTVGIGLIQSLKVRVERLTGPEFNRTLEDAVKCADIPRVGKNGGRLSDGDNVTRRYYENRNYFIEQLEKVLDVSGSRALTHEGAELLNEFVKFLQTRVAVVLVKTTDFQTAYTIFEILNNRGLPLSNLDLFRNFLFQELSGAGKQQHQLPAVSPEQRWQKWEEDYQINEEFLGRWVESVTGTKQRSSSFTEIREMYDSLPLYPGISRIDDFVGKFERALDDYTRISSDDLPKEDPKLFRMIDFLKSIGNFRYSQNLLLALVRHFGYRGEPNSTMMDFLDQYRRYLLVLLFEPGRRFVSGPIYTAIGSINKGDIAQALDIFQTTPEQLARVREALDQPIEDVSVVRALLVSYVRAEQAETDDVVDMVLQLPRITVEHILPQNPASGTDWLRLDPKFRKSFVHKLGNMTLLTGGKNSQAKNTSFAKKKEVYAHTFLPLTKDLAAWPDIDHERLQKRHQFILDRLFREFGI